MNATPGSSPKAKSDERRSARPTAKPVLRFSPTAWAKLLFCRDRRGTEVGGFGVARAEDLLHVDAFATVKQRVTPASIAFDDEAVADFFDGQVDAGRRPEQFARIWCHTHPGESPRPSLVDEETFHRVFGRCDWAVMFIVGTTGKTYARLRFNVGPGGQAVIPVEVDYACDYGPSDREAWETEFRANVRGRAWRSDRGRADVAREDDVFGAEEPVVSDDWDADEWMAAFEDLEPDGRRAVLQELASRPDLWHEAEEVMPW